MAYQTDDVPTNPRALGGELSDSQLLGRFIATQDESAFAALVERYGRLVLGVCRRVLCHEHDADDAFQATFLVLARKAHTIRKQASIGCWLYGTAYRIARKAKMGRDRRKVRESPLNHDPEGRPNSDWMVWELRALLDEEINHLPNHYRQPFVLCYLQGKTNEEAAQQLGCPAGTVASRLGRARERLRQSLHRRGLTVPATLITIALGGYASPATVPIALADGVVKVASLFARADAGAAALAPHAVDLAQRFLRALVTTRLKIISVSAVAIALVTIGALLMLPRFGVNFFAGGQGQAAVHAQPTPPRDEQRIQGTWSASFVEFEGHQLPATGIDLRFASDEFYFMSQGRALFSMHFTLNPTTEPKSLDLRMADGSFWPAIYALDGDEMRVCYSMNSQTRPLDFATKAGGKMYSYHLRRQAEPDRFSD